MATGTGNLPNPGMSFSPFAILTAEEQNNLVENIESLATGTGIGDGAIGTSDLANAAVTKEKIDKATILALDVLESTDFASPVTAPANTTVDFKSNQTFAVTKANSVVEINILSGINAGTAASTFINMQIIIDSAGTPITRKIATGSIPQGNSGYPFIEANGRVYVTGLSVGNHTIKTTVRATATVALYCRPATAPDFEFYRTQVIEHI